VAGEVVASLAGVVSPPLRQRRAGAETVRDSAWFSSLYERSIDSVYRYAHMLVRDPQRAEDVAADVFLKAWRGRGGLRDDTSALSWLLTITHNSAMSLVRSQREVAGLDALAETEDESSDPSTEFFAEFEAARVRAAIARLTTEQQHVILLRFFEGLPHEEVARRLGSNSNAVRATQFRALSRLRKLLQEDSVARTA
jgi:RNA polymerase sigma-70 factor (ECF subfamily)